MLSWQPTRRHTPRSGILLILGGMCVALLVCSNSLLRTGLPTLSLIAGTALAGCFFVSGINAMTEEKISQEASTRKSRALWVCSVSLQLAGLASLGSAAVISFSFPRSFIFAAVGVAGSLIFLVSLCGVVYLSLLRTRRASLDETRA